MREILFRGLHRRKGEKVRLDGTPVESRWVYGGYCKYNEERRIIYQTEPEIAKFSVYADTVGQYTGLTDRNGVKIFEGDIVSFADCWDEQHKGFVYWNSGSYNVDCSKSSNKEHGNYFRLFTAYACVAKVIGNIHDNPELLGGDEE
ncbi:MAG: YopX family protein [Prevotella sp.]|nr:YopX family protein [Alistipes senegalensis]MCM1358838.1 YopX family protein [Prevotella sp.]MCM1474571.1 YopX family protein [Muribaculaceae bacterium]